MPLLNPRRALCLAILLALAALALPVPAAATHNPSVVDDSRALSGPVTNGVTVVWTVAAAPPAADGVIELWAGDAHALTAGVFLPDCDCSQLAIDQNLVVFRQEEADDSGGDIRGLDLITGETFDIAVTAQDEYAPAISGSQVVWVSHDSATETITLYHHDINTDALPTVIDELDWNVYGGGLRSPRVDNGRVAWLRAEVESLHTESWQALTMNIGDAEPAVAAEGFSTISGPGAEIRFYMAPSLDLAGNIVVVTANLELTAYDAGSDNRFTIASGAWSDPALYSPARRAVTDGRYIFWLDYRYTDNPHLAFYNASSDTASLRSDIYAHDLESFAQFRVLTDAGDNTLGNLKNGVLAWSWLAGDEASAAVHAAPLDDLNPAAPRTDPGASPDWTYYPETGHTLGGPFRAYWEANGGLPVFGYPMTIEYTQFSHPAQFLERQRFEHHPENAGTPYEFLLGLLGAEHAIAHGLDQSDPFLPREPETPTTPNTAYFSETGHWLSHAFKTYWETHGLEFGDPGTSYRESLALFGYPISEEFTDPTTGLTVQYFERAVFEWHSGNDDPYKVLLRRLGAEVLETRGW